jgi:hypothetical protein
MFAPIYVRGREALPDHEYEQRRKDKEHERISRQLVCERRQRDDSRYF